MRSNLFIALVSLIILVSITFSCDVDRECFICPPAEVDCNTLYSQHDTLFITGFELGENPTELGGNLSKWNDTLSSIKVATWYDTTGGGAWNSQYYAKLEILCNDRNSPEQWSGGGLVLDLTDCVNGIDLSDYDLLQFEVKTFPGSRLGFTNIKMQGAEIEMIKNDSTPERPIAQYGIFPSNNWETINIPIDSFNVLHSWESWIPFDRAHATKLVTTTINRFSPEPLDGILGVDNVRFVRN